LIDINIVENQFVLCNASIWNMKLPSNFIVTEQTWLVSHENNVNILKVSLNQKSKLI